MDKGRLEAFSDGVIAVIITIMVLELKPPQGTDLHALGPILPVLLVYVLSFANVGIYWNNHHHVFAAVGRIDGRVMWANLHLLFWLSLVPFVTSWEGESHAAALPTVCYAIVLLMAAIAFFVLVNVLVAIPANASLARAMRGDRKTRGSMLAYAIATALAFAVPYLSVALIVLVALVWFVPERRIEREVSED